jgi:hypothetical protein
MTDDAASTGTPNVVRVRSSLMVPLLPQWSVVDAIEVRGPGGVMMSVASYPAPEADLAEIAGFDVVAGTERVGVPESAKLFGGLSGLVQRFDSAHSEDDAEGHAASFVQLAGYAVDSGRVLVARVSCPRGRFDELASTMRSLIASASLDRGVLGTPPAIDQSPPSVLADYRSGKPIAALPAQPAPGDLTTLRAGWRQTSGPERADSSGGAVLTGAELTAAARLFGRRTFPAVAPIDAAVENVLLNHARAVLGARNLVRFSTPSDVQVDGTLTEIVRRALQADLVVDVALAGVTRRRCTYFVSVDAALRLARFPDDVYTCRHIEPGAVAGDLLAWVGTLPDAGGGPDTLERGQLPADGPFLRATVRTAANGGSAVDLSSTSLVSVPDLGCYADEQSGNWQRVDPDAQRRRLLAALAE